MIPHLMNCAHQGDGWCLKCVDSLQKDLEQAREALECKAIEIGGSMAFVKLYKDVKKERDFLKTALGLTKATIDLYIATDDLVARQLDELRKDRDCLKAELQHLGRPCDTCGGRYPNTPPEAECPRCFAEMQQEYAEKQRQEIALIHNEIIDALEARGYFHMGNGKAIGALIDDLKGGLAALMEVWESELIQGRLSYLAIRNGGTDGTDEERAWVKERVDKAKAVLK